MSAIPSLMFSFYQSSRIFNFSLIFYSSSALCVMPNLFYFFISLNTLSLLTSFFVSDYVTSCFPLYRSFPSVPFLLPHFLFSLQVGDLSTTLLSFRGSRCSLSTLPHFTFRFLSVLFTLLLRFIVVSR